MLMPNVCSTYVPILEHDRWDTSNITAEDIVFYSGVFETALFRVQCLSPSIIFQIDVLETGDA